MDFESAALPPTGIAGHDHGIEPATKREEKDALYPVVAAPEITTNNNDGTVSFDDDEVEPTEEEYLTLRKCAFRS
jgi:hypothetical protein